MTKEDQKRLIHRRYDESLIEILGVLPNIQTDQTSHLSPNINLTEYERES